MKYKLATGVEKPRRTIRKYLLGAIASAIMVGGAALPAFAANDYCGASANGCEHAAAAGAQCDSGAASGAFGAFGPGNDWRGGANGPATGLANSAVCGNRQGNL